MKKCHECGSEKILQNAKTDESGYGHFTLKAYGKPEAKVFKDAVNSKVGAKVCVNCGYIQFYVKDLFKINRVYEMQQGRFNP
jgi:predicted nucleic-acid-binding Zn-ribbon protein